MKVRQLSFHITILQISILLIVSLFLVIVNNLFVRDLLMSEFKLQCEVSSKNLFQQLNIERNNLDKLSFEIDSLSVTKKIDSSLICNALKLHDQDRFVELVGIYDFAGYQLISESYQYGRLLHDKIIMQDIDSDLLSFKKSTSNSILLMKKMGPFASNSILYLKKVSNSRIFIFLLSQKYFANLVHPLLLTNGAIIAISNKNQQTIFCTDSINSENLVRSSFETKSTVDLKRSSMDNIIVKNAKSDDAKFIVYTQYNNELNLYFLYIINRSFAFPFFFSYLQKLILLVLIVFIITTLFLFYTNKKSISPINDILDLMQSNSYSKIRGENIGDEFLVIRKGIDSLHNQLNHYMLNLEKNKQDTIKLSRDLELAKRLQRNILPGNDFFDNEHRNFEIFAISDPLYEVGGDMYDFFMIDDTHLLVTIGDITGKGIAGSLYMIFALSLLRSIAKPGLKVEEIVSNLNYKLTEENISDQFVTMFVGIIDLSKNTLSFTNAAHSFPYIIHSEGFVEKIEAVHGIPVGIYSDRVYSSTEIQMSEGDTLFLYTDGLIEAKDENNIIYTDEVLRYNLIGTWFLNSKEIVEKIEESVKSFRGNVKAEDDLSLLALKLHQQK